MITEVVQKPLKKKKNGSPTLVLSSVPSQTPAPKANRQAHASSRHHITAGHPAGSPEIAGIYDARAGGRSTRLWALARETIAKQRKHERGQRSWGPTRKHQLAPIPSPHPFRSHLPVHPTASRLPLKGAWQQGEESYVSDVKSCKTSKQEGITFNRRELPQEA